MKTPIESGTFYAEVFGETYLYSPMTDSIQVFPDQDLNHVHYFDDENQQMIFQFLGQGALDLLHEHGLPHTIRDSITQFEYDAYTDWVVERNQAEIQELEPEAFK